MVGFKVTFVSTAIGIIIANSETVPSLLLVLPAVAAIFFDLLIISYGFSIKRMGNYVRFHLKPQLIDHLKWPNTVPLWEQYVGRKVVRQKLSIISHWGLTLIASAIGIAGVYFSTIIVLALVWKLCIIIILALMLLYVAYAHEQPKKFNKPVPWTAEK